MTTWIFAVALLSAGSPPATELPPVDLVRGLRSARIAHLEGDHDRELETLKQARETFPQEMSLLYMLLSHHRDHGVSEQQVRELRGTLLGILADPTIEPSLSVLRLAVTDSAEDAELRDGIIDHLERRIDPEKPSPELLDLLRVAYLEAERRDGVIETLERLVATEPTWFRRWSLVKEYRLAERWEDGADFLGRWLAQDQKKDEPRNLRPVYIDLLSRTGRLEEVVTQVELYLQERQAELGAVELDWQGTTSAKTPSRVRMTVHDLAVVKTAAWNLRDAGKDAAAERLFRRVIELAEEDEEARQALLYLYGTAEQLQALEAENASRWEMESDPNALFEEGTERLTAGDAEGAVELLKKAAAGLPDLEPAWYNLGMAAYRTEDWQTVADAFGRATELNGERGQSFFYRGIALEKLGQCEAAVKALEKALLLDPSRHLAHYYLATCYQWLGQMDKSKKHRALYDASR